MKQTITLIGKIVFEPENKTKKHHAQSSWKRLAMVNFNCDVAEYYAWFILRRFNLPLNKPLRGAHISFINDSIKDFSNNGTKTIDEINSEWERVKKKWNNKKVEIKLEISPRTDSKYWWLRVSDESRIHLQEIREELGLSKPYWGLHMTIGHANDKNLFHSKYIHKLIEQKYIK